MGLNKFEELQIMKFAWRNNIPDLAAWNSGLVEEVDLEEFRVLLSADNWENEFDKDLDSIDAVIEL